MDMQQVHKALHAAALQHALHTDSWQAYARLGQGTAGLALTPAMGSASFLLRDN